MAKNESIGSDEPHRQRRGQHVTDMVLVAAREALSRDGYPDLSIDTIAEDLGIAKTTIYRRWPTKAALINAAADFSDAPSLTPPDTGRVRDDLVQLISATFDLVAGRHNFYQALIRAAAGHPELAAPVQRQTHRRRNEYRIVVNRGIARGELPPDADVDAVFDHLYGPLWFRILVSGRSPDELDPEQLVDTVLWGVAAAPPAGS